jgi:hypothetical protein
MVHGGYELSSRRSFGVSVGGLWARQSTDQRLIPAIPVELATTPTVQNVFVNDRIALQGALAGGWGGFTFGSSFLVQLRLGLGAFLGTVSDTRSAGSNIPDTWSMRGETTQEHPVRAAYLASEIRFGWTVRPHVTLNAGVSLMGMYMFSPPTWDASGTHLVVLEDQAGATNYGRFGAPDAAPERILSTLEIAILPGLGLRYDL